MKDNAMPIVISGNAILAHLLAAASGITAGYMIGAAQYLAAGIALTAFAGWLCAADLYSEINTRLERREPSQ